MSSKRIGELLSQLVPLTPHDIEEILHEQFATRKPFGDIALTMGLCRPEHVWKAWCGQLLDGRPRHINLETIGIDTQAVSTVSCETARRHGLMPLRVLGDVIIIAVPDTKSLDAISTDLAMHARKRVRFVIANESQIRRAIEKHYPKLQATG
jgi:hypothetical protein